MESNLFDSVKQKIKDKHQQICLAKKNIESLNEKIEISRQTLEDFSTSQQIAQIVAQGIQQNVHKQISKVVSKCLKTIFDEPYEFCIMFDRKRGKTEAKIVFLKDGAEFDPLNSTGGGVIDIAAFACRLSSIILSKPKSRRIMIMDEPFRFLSQDKRPKIKMLLQELTKTYGFQFIMVTHAEELVTGKVVRL